MKKSVSVFLVLCLMAAFFGTFGASAYGVGSYNAIIGVSAANAACGDEIIVTVSARDIKNTKGQYTEGLLTTSFNLVYDKNIFSRSSYTVKVPEKWEFFDNVQVDGEWKVFTAWDDGEIKGITANDAIIVTYKLKINSAAKLGKTTLTVKDVEGSNGDIALFLGSGSSADIIIEAAGTSTSEKLSVVSGSKCVVENGYFKNLPENTSVASVLSMLENSGVTAADVNGKALNNDALVGTGSVLSLIKDGKTIDTAIIVIKGDTDGNGVVNSTDYMQIKRYLLRTYDFEPAFLVAADTDNSGDIGSTDYMQIKRHFLKTAKLF